MLRENLDHTSARVQAVALQDLHVWGYCELLLTNTNEEILWQCWGIWQNFILLSDSIWTQCLENEVTCHTFLHTFRTSWLIDWEYECIRLLFHQSRRPCTTVSYFMWPCTVCTQNRCCRMIVFFGIRGDSEKILSACSDFSPLDVKTARVITGEITKKLEQNWLNVEGCKSLS